MAEGGTANSLLASLIKALIKALAKILKIDLPDDWGQQVDSAISDWQKSPGQGQGKANNPDYLSFFKYAVDSTVGFLKNVSIPVVKVEEGKEATKEEKEAVTEAKRVIFGIKGEEAKASIDAKEKGFKALEIMADEKQPLDARKAASVELSEAVETLKKDPAHFNSNNETYVDFHMTDDLCNLVAPLEMFLGQQKLEEEKLAAQKSAPDATKETSNDFAKPDPTKEPSNDFAKGLEATVITKTSELSKTPPESITPLSAVDGLATNINKSETNKATAAATAKAKETPVAEATPAAATATAPRPGGPRP